MTLGRALRLPTVWLLALGIFATNLGGYGLVSWLATAVQGFLGKAAPGADDADVLRWTGGIFLCGIVGVFVSGRSSDRTGKPKWHCVAGQLGAAVFLILSVLPDQSWPLRYTWLCLAGFFANFWFSPFWVLPTLALTSSAAAVSIAFINMCANVSGYLSNHIVGEMKQAGLSDEACFRFLAGGFAVGAALVALVRVRKPTHKPPAEVITTQPAEK